MTSDRNGVEPLERACELVGRFFYYFSRVEEQLDAAITKLFKLPPKYAPIVTANFDFYKKLQVVRCAVDLQAKAGKQIKNAKKTLGGIEEINNDRQIVAHSVFEAAEPDGVRFRRVVAKEELKIKTSHWTTQRFKQRFKKLQRLESNLRQIITALEPEQIKWPAAENVAPLPAYLSPAFFMGWGESSMPHPLRDIERKSRGK